MKDIPEMAIEFLTRDRRRCSFCKRPAHIARRLIAGPHAYICDVCVIACSELLYRFDRRPGSQRVPEVLPLNTDAECVICRTWIQPEETYHVSGRGGPICRECIDT